MAANETDTREQLEADVGDAVTILLMAANGGFEGSTGNVMKNAKVLLNMPKERALDSEVFRALADMVERERAEQTAERDKLCAELNRKQRVCDIQRESFLGVERRCAELARLALALWRRMDALRKAGIAPSKGDLDALASRLAEHGIGVS